MTVDAAGQGLVFAPMPTGWKSFQDLTGRRIGRWLVLGYAGRMGTRTPRWHTRCDCGTQGVVIGRSLRVGASESCGCLAREASRGRSVHGKAGTAIYETYRGMVWRCTNENAPSYPRYGGRGITVCDRWQNFASFYADMGDPPFAGAQLDRIDNARGYEPGNVRWATRKQNQRNMRSNVKLSFRGETLCLAEWAERLGLARNGIRKRLSLGWTMEEALTVPRVVS